ncbi:MAG: hypothetical protein F6K56_34445, partial [Moorea sp. SIO3G5]|nr:hypothetical protein [Moorena sp. SIO3G5]
MSNGTEVFVMADLKLCGATRDGEQSLAITESAPVANSTVSTLCPPLGLFN